MPFVGNPLSDCCLLTKQLISAERSPRACKTRPVHGARMLERLVPRCSVGRRAGKHARFVDRRQLREILFVRHWKTLN